MAVYDVSDVASPRRTSARANPYFLTCGMAIDWHTLFLAAGDDWLLGARIE